MGAKELGRALNCPSDPLCRPSIGAKGSCQLNIRSCSTTWGPPLPSSCCSIPCLHGGAGGKQGKKRGRPSILRTGHLPDSCCLSSE